MESKQTQLKFPCEKCPKIFPSKTQLREHCKKSHPKQRFRTYHCHTCGEKFDKHYLELYRHEEEVHGKLRNYFCQFCDKKFITASNRTRHEFEEHTEICRNVNSKLSCLKCGAIFKYPKVFEKHQLNPCKAQNQIKKNAKRKHSETLIDDDFKAPKVPKIEYAEIPVGDDFLIFMEEIDSEIKYEIQNEEIPVANVFIEFKEEFSPSWSSPNHGFESEIINPFEIMSPTYIGEDEDFLNCLSLDVFSHNLATFISQKEELL